MEKAKNGQFYLFSIGNEGQPMLDGVCPSGVTDFEIKSGVDFKGYATLTLTLKVDIKKPVDGL